MRERILSATVGEERLELPARDPCNFSRASQRDLPLFVKLKRCFNTELRPRRKEQPQSLLDRLSFAAEDTCFYQCINSNSCITIHLLSAPGAIEASFYLQPIIAHCFANDKLLNQLNPLTFCDGA